MPTEKRPEHAKRWDEAKAMAAIRKIQDSKFDELKNAYGMVNDRFDLRGIPIVDDVGRQDWSKYGPCEEVVVTTRIRDVDFSNAVSSGGTVASCECCNCIFDGLEATESIISGIFIGCSFIRASLGNVYGKYEECSFGRAKFSGWISADSISECTFKDAAFKSCKIFQCVFNNCNFNQARFVSTEFSECRFNSCDFTQATGNKCEFGSRCIFDNCAGIAGDSLRSWSLFPDDLPEIIGDA